MSYLKSLMETEEMQTFLTEHQDLICEGAQEISEFSEVVKEYVRQNPSAFLEQNLNDTYKNIRIFSEVATAQYISELTAIYNQDIDKIEENSRLNDPLGDYL